MYTAPLADMQFLIDDVIDVAGKLGSLERFVDVGVGPDQTFSGLSIGDLAPDGSLTLDGQRQEGEDQEEWMSHDVGSPCKGTPDVWRTC